MLPHVIKSIADRETPVVTPVHGPRPMKLGSGKVVGKVLMVDHDPPQVSAKLGEASTSIFVKVHLFNRFINITYK